MPSEPCSRREIIVGLTALALLGAALVALLADVYPHVAIVVAVVAYSVNAVTLARGLHR